MMDKAVIFVVEGKTDKTALENIFKKIYRHRDIQFEFTRGPSGPKVMNGYY